MTGVISEEVQCIWSPASVSFCVIDSAPRDTMETPLFSFFLYVAVEANKDSVL